MERKGLWKLQESGKTSDDNLCVLHRSCNTGNQDGSGSSSTLIFDVQDCNWLIPNAEPKKAHSVHDEVPTLMQLALFFEGVVFLA